MLFGLIGKKQSGKSTVAERLVHHGFMEYAFATALKDMLVNAGMCTHEEVYGSVKYPEVRRILQLVGTNIFRNQVAKDFWIERLLISMENHIVDFPTSPSSRQTRSSYDLVVSDVRFQNEAKFIKTFEDGFLVRISRPAQDDGDSHLSETELEMIPADIVLYNNGTVEELLQEVDKLVHAKRR